MPTVKSKDDIKLKEAEDDDDTKKQIVLPAEEVCLFVIFCIAIIVGLIILVAVLC